MIVAAIFSVFLASQPNPSKEMIAAACAVAREIYELAGGDLDKAIGIARERGHSSRAIKLAQRYCKP